MHTVPWSNSQVFRRLLAPGISPVTDDVKPYASLIGLDKMTRAPIGNDLAKHDLRPPSGGGSWGSWVGWVGSSYLLCGEKVWVMNRTEELHCYRCYHFCGCCPTPGPSLKNTRVPRLPEFADWAQEQGDAPAILFDKEFCESMIQQIGPQLDGKIPVSRGFPIAEVFTLKPLEFGKPNTLVCFVSNLFPPMLTVNWQHHSIPVEGFGPTFVSAVDGLSFQAFSYLNFTPESSDIFSCIVTHEIDRYTAIAYWVPRNALPSDLLENVLCGVAFGLGVLGIIVGIVLIIYFRKPCSD
ncbi:HLA class II histocompatibility antigen, DM alpha chain isoform X2 [Pongo pygmaeus]|uniref:HLA class II histocompatibility antigen, DM alpha chain isoform X2 n=1 Tax=Pongo pygmaeus TaxID=9600 RepID=UPI0023E2A93F|nr:HLA class II histocompatibility antigen, DM alpha chain isoform X2 [Pongo pygmaeus]